MKFSLKVFCSALMVTALAFSAGGYLLIGSTFRSALTSSYQLALEENQLLRLSFLSSAGQVTGYFTDGTARNIARSLEFSGNGARLIRLSAQPGAPLYSTAALSVSGLSPDAWSLLEGVEADSRVCQVVPTHSGYLVQTVSLVQTNERTFYLETFFDISPVFRQRSDSVALYQLLTCGVLAVCAVAILFLSHLLTTPIRRLAEATRRFSGGDYSHRAAIASQDEIGALTQDFNAMADSLERKIRELEVSAQRQEDFIAAFAHELKTPLTAVIGYGDMIRSQELPPDQRMKAAGYIVSEGRRLEALSFKLLELIVVRRHSPALATHSAVRLLDQAAAILTPSFRQSGVALEAQAQDAGLYCEPDLLKTLLFNLCDNARKASAPGSCIYLTGARDQGGYRLTVRDQGQGMTPEQLTQAADPFYMADKSRSRAQNGAGLGLALCAAIAQLHGSRLELSSTPDCGTTVSLLLPDPPPAAPEGGVPV